MKKYRVRWVGRTSRMPLSPYQRDNPIIILGIHLKKTLVKKVWIKLGLNAANIP